MKYSIACVIGFFAFSSLALACDREAASGAMTNIRAMAKVTDTGSHLRFEWWPALDNQSPDRRMRFVRVAADADACLTGRAREHRHFLSGRYFAVASPSSGIRSLE